MAGHCPPHELVGKRFVPGDVDFSRPVYQASFDDPAELKGWKLEGGDVARVTEDGNLLLKSDKHQVFWLKKQIPADFLLEFTVRPHDRKQGLNIVFFNTTELNGENIFRAPIQPRNGSFKQYWDGDLKSYHVSYWSGAGANAGTRGGQANLRRNKGNKFWGCTDYPKCKTTFPAGIGLFLRQESLPDLLAKHRGCYTDHPRSLGMCFYFEDSNSISYHAIILSLFDARNQVRMLNNAKESVAISTIRTIRGDT